ncbi:ragulator complex protein LAMTOR4 isoform X1 [Anser cygnoides]
MRKAPRREGRGSAAHAQWLHRCSLRGARFWPCRGLGVATPEPSGTPPGLCGKLRGPRDKTTALTQGLERVPDQLGYLVICDGAVLASAGDLENDERTATVLAGLVATACGLRLPRGHQPPFRRLSVVFGDHSLLVTASAQKLFVVKRQNRAQEPATA